MTYLCCEACGFRTVRGPLSLASYCPRCRLRGRIVPFTESAKAPSVVRDLSGPVRAVLASERRRNVAPRRA
jgi:hypothetical protein